MSANANAKIMKGNMLETIVGAVVLAVSACFVYFAYTVSGEKINDGYILKASFDDIGGLTSGSDVTLNGIKVGIVKSVEIGKAYQADVEILMKKNISIPRDSSAEITSDGLMGNKHMAIVVGYDERKLKPGDEIELTKPAMNLEKLVNRFVAGGKEAKS